MVDVVILSYAKTPYHELLTKQCLSTLKKCGVKYNVFLHEQNITPLYEGCNQFYVNEPFNYNKLMNTGARMGSSEYIAFCNNDLEFENDSLKILIEGMQRENLDSASPFCRLVHGVESRLTPTGVIRLGWNVRLEFAGWCFVMKRSSFEKMGGLDEDFSFWCADNATVEQLKGNRMRHGLVTNAIVNHISSGENTLKEMSHSEKEEMTFNQICKFNKKFDKNLWGMGK
jgi:GT2 family glycosyltransferase